MTRSCLLITSHPQSTWANTFIEALSPEVEVEPTQEADICSEPCENRYTIIVIDEGTVNQVVPLIKQLRDKYGPTPIVVATLSRTWRGARDVLRAGAVDYIRKSTDKAVLAKSIQDIIQTGRRAPPVSEPE